MNTPRVPHRRVRSCLLAICCGAVGWAAVFAQSPAATGAKSAPPSAAATAEPAAAVDGVYHHHLSNGISLVASFRGDGAGQLSIFLPELSGLHADFKWRMWSPTIVALKIGNDAEVRAFDRAGDALVARVELMQFIKPGMRFEKPANARAAAPTPPRAAAPTPARAPAPAPTRDPAPVRTGAPEDEAAIDRVLQRFHEVSGRAAAETQVQSREWWSTFEVQGLRGQVITHEKAPDRFIRVTTLAGLATEAYGFDGTTAWRWTTEKGYTKLQGEEAAILRAQSQFNARFGARATQRRWLGRDTLDGRAVEKIELVVDGEKSVESFDVETGLRVRSEQDGEIIMFSDFRRVGPEQIAHRETVSTGVAVKVNRVQQNVAIADGHFVPRRGGIPSWVPDNQASTGAAMKDRFNEAVYWLVERSEPGPILRMLPYGMVEAMGGREAATQRLLKEYGPDISTHGEIRFHEEKGRVWAVFLVSYNEIKEPKDRVKDFERLSVIVFSDSSENWRFVPAWLLRNMKTRQVMPMIPSKVEEMLDALIREEKSGGW